MTTVRTGGVLGTLTGGAKAVRGIASRNKGVDNSMPAMTTSKPVFQVRRSSVDVLFKSQTRTLFFAAFDPFTCC